MWLDQGAKVDDRVAEILTRAADVGARVERVERQELDRMAQGRVHNGVIAEADPLPGWTVKSLVDELLSRDELPFLVVCDELAYEHNLGAILRSSLGFGVGGVVLPTRRGASVSPVVQRVAMGGAEEVPVVRESIYATLKHLKRSGIRTVAADMSGRPATEVPLQGAVALVMGAEGRGLSEGVMARCDDAVSIPLAGDLESLNVSVAAALLMYEKRRQDGWL